MSLVERFTAPSFIGDEDFRHCPEFWWRVFIETETKSLSDRLMQQNFSMDCCEHNSCPAVLQTSPVVPHHCRNVPTTPTGQRHGQAKAAIVMVVVDGRQRSNFRQAAPWLREKAGLLSMDELKL